MKHFIKLLRLKNLLIIAALQYLLLYCLVIPQLTYHYSSLLGIAIVPQFSNFDFFLLVLATILITAAGYVINDYFDMSIDMINKPENVIIGKHISLRTAVVTHWILNIIGVGLGFYLAWKIDLINIGFIFLFTAGLLWFYSTIFKRELIIGNVIVAILTALVPILVMIFEIIPLNYTYRNQLQYYYLNFNDIVFWILGFSYFAFITTLIREIIKDIEDFEGDNAYGRKSIPIVYGIKNAKLIVCSLQTIFVGSIILSSILYIENSIAQWYITIAVVLPSLFLVYKVAVAKKESDYTFASKISKSVMVTGIAFLLLLYFITRGFI